MTRRHYLLARNRHKLPFNHMTALQQQLLMNNFRYTELLTDGHEAWIWLPRITENNPATREDFVLDLVYRVSNACKPKGFKETP